jgi:hypothetical protein
MKGKEKPKKATKKAAPATEKKPSKGKKTPKC